MDYRTIIDVAFQKIKPIRAFDSDSSDPFFTYTMAQCMVKHSKIYDKIYSKNFHLPEEYEIIVRAAEVDDPVDVVAIGNLEEYNRYKNEADILFIKTKSFFDQIQYEKFVFGEMVVCSKHTTLIRSLIYDLNQLSR